MQDKDAINQRILHLWDVEKLSKRQISVQLDIDRGRVRRIIEQSGESVVPAIRKHNLDQYRALMAQWYTQYPRLQAIQVYERLKNYGYTGCYESVKVGTREYRKPLKEVFHPLIFNPGQEAQVDWFHFKHATIGAVAGFLYVLAYSRYAWGMFYPRTTFEFFLAGHMECFKHLGGLARTGRYDNLKSAVLRRKPQIEYNPQFMDFARFYGFSVHACNPYSGNEKGRVERIIRDARVFLETETFIDLADLNRKFQMWLEKRNNTIHRSTERTPKDLLSSESLLKPPANTYSAKRIIPVRISSTALVEFDANKYSVPSSCAGKMADIAAYPGNMEVWLGGQKIAIHKRCFGRRQIIQNPLHAERLLNRTPRFKQKRIQESIMAMDPAFKVFVERQEDDEMQQSAAYQIYQLIRNHSRSMVLSAVRELNGMNCVKIKALMSLLRVPSPEEPPAVWPKDQRLLNLNYEERDLTDYDPNTKPVQDA